MLGIILVAWGSFKPEELEDEEEEDVRKVDSYGTHPSLGVEYFYSQGSHLQGSYNTVAIGLRQSNIFNFPQLDSSRRRPAQRLHD